MGIIHVKVLLFAVSNTSTVFHVRLPSWPNQFLFAIKLANQMVSIPYQLSNCGCILSTQRINYQEYQIKYTHFWAINSLTLWMFILFTKYWQQWWFKISAVPGTEWLDWMIVKDNILLCVLQQPIVGLRLNNFRRGGILYVAPLTNHALNELK